VTSEIIPPISCSSFGFRLLVILPIFTSGSMIVSLLTLLFSSSTFKRDIVSSLLSDSFLVSLLSIVADFSFSLAFSSSSLSSSLTFLTNRRLYANGLSLISAAISSGLSSSAS
jgi:hypothetical protein